MRHFLFDLLQRVDLPRGLPHQHLIQQHPHRPNISLLGVGGVAEDLWRHVEGATHNGCQNLLVDLEGFGEAQVADFETVVVEKQVCWFHVAVHYLLLMKDLETFQDVLNWLEVTLKKYMASDSASFPLRFR